MFSHTVPHHNLHPTMGVRTLAQCIIHESRPCVSMISLKTGFEKGVFSGSDRG